MTQRVIGYVRVSTDEQHLGPAAQREAMVRWCREHGAELVAVHEDLGVSGGAPLDRRPGMMAAIAALTDLEATGLLVAKRDRLARDTLAAAMLERLAERAGARILCVDGVGNEEGPEGLLMRRMVDAFAEYERAMIRGRTRAALAVKKARRERTGSLPYGYGLAADGLHLEADPSEQVVVDLVREYTNEGLSLRQVAARLTERGLAPRSGGCWYPQTIKRIAAGEAA